MPNPPPTNVVEPISEAARAESLRETLARAPSPDCINVFGYASLMWNPCFEFASAQKGCLQGYRRGCSIWSVFAQGSPETPGLGFALEEMDGASCEGVVFALPETTGEEELRPLWEREMWTNAYSAEWVNVEIANENLCALTFVIRKDHPQYAGDMSIAEQAAYIASASGKYGPCCDYLSETVKALKSEGIHDPELDQILSTVESLKS